jgi:hypothetical protein
MRLLNIIIGTLLFVFTNSLEQTNITVWLSAAAYCGKYMYNTMVLNGPAKGFLVKDIIYDSKSDLQGYIGIMPAHKTIYVVFRGSSSIRNWIKDLSIRMVPYKTFPECNCNVHSGFYDSTLNVINQVSKSVRYLINSYGYQLIITGHSYGAAISQLISMELSALSIESSVYNFGQPRIGDIDYSIFVNSQIKTLWRITHNKDIVPHISFTKAMEYYHSCREAFENEDGNIKICSNSDCEDETCSQQYSISQTNVEDHEVYLGHNMDCEGSIE